MNKTLKTILTFAAVALLLTGCDLKKEEDGAEKKKAATIE